jgi:hypothetical protein
VGFAGGSRRDNHESIVSAIDIAEWKPRFELRDVMVDGCTRNLIYVIVAFEP